MSNVTIAYYRLPAAECQGMLYFSLENDTRPCYNNCTCGISSLVEHLLPKQDRRVRFPYPAPNQKSPESNGFRGFSLFINGLRFVRSSIILTSRCRVSLPVSTFRVQNANENANERNIVLHSVSSLILRFTRTSTTSRILTGTGLK